MARISTKNQITIPVAALEEAGLRAGEAVTVEPAGDGERRVRRPRCASTMSLVR
jgi:bifunctional DNA-binding transcriptional regulator/antitoxin component of YhaV-PrlF toxin-antitoxin module